MTYRIHHQSSIYRGAGMCITCTVESFYQDSSSDMRDHFDTGVRWLARVDARKRHAVSVWSLRKGQSMCGQQKDICPSCGADEMTDHPDGMTGMCGACGVRQ